MNRRQSIRCSWLNELDNKADPHNTLTSRALFAAKIRHKTQTQERICKCSNDDGLSDSSTDPLAYCQPQWKWMYLSTRLLQYFMTQLASWELWKGLRLSDPDAWSPISTSAGVSCGLDSSFRSDSKTQASLMPSEFGTSSLDHFIGAKMVDGQRCVQMVLASPANGISLYYFRWKWVYFKSFT